MHNRGPSIEYEIIHNPQAVDLLVALAYSAAVEQVLDDPLPKHLGLRVPVPNNADIRAPPLTRFAAGGVVPPQPVALGIVQPDADGLCEFDKLEVPQVRP